MNFGSRDEEVAIPPSYAFIQVNSKDRNVSSSQTSPFAVAVGGDRQPWNDFVVQKPANILQSFARRIGVVEVNFPWGIPNITSANNILYILEGTTVSSFTVPAGFYSGTSLASVLNGFLTAAYPTNTPSFTFNTVNNHFVFNANGGSYSIIYGPTVALPTYEQYYASASLVKTMGFSFAQINLVNPTGLIGATTQLLYTQYVDIVSDKLHYNNEVQDGSSQNNKSQTSVLCRIFCSDESSNNTMTTGQAPFTIHRQFRNPKMLKWNPNSLVDWFQVQVYDEYGNLVQLPAPLSAVGTPSASYPDFQLVVLATED
jgi:hypothetical protein